MSNKKTSFVPVALVLASFLGVAAANAQGRKTAQPSLSESPQLRTTDDLVPHVSTVPANAGNWVELFVREKVIKIGSAQRPAVLMIPGATISTVPDFDLQFENYSWMEYLAKAGYDVFAMDPTGFGLSPRPMMDNPCNNSPAQQQLYLIPKTLAQPCPAPYPYQLTSIYSDWDEIDTIVEYIRDLRDVSKVHLIGWSFGGNRAGGYAAKHSDKVSSMFLLAPGNYFSSAPSSPPSPLPLPGVPSNILGIGDFHAAWDSQVECDNQFAPGIRDAINWTMIAFDPLGSTWGNEGVRRAPNLNTTPASPWTPWNKGMASQVRTPTLIINGDLDKTVLPSVVLSLYDDLAAAQKIHVHVACSSHYLIWETRHEILLRASEEWLRQGTFAGQVNGTFAVDTAGQVRKEK